MLWLVVSLLVVIAILLAVIAAILNYGFLQVSQDIAASARDNRISLEALREDIHSIERRIDRLTNDNDSTIY